MAIDQLDVRTIINADFLSISILHRHSTVNLSFGTEDPQWVEARRFVLNLLSLYTGKVANDLDIAKQEQVNLSAVIRAAEAPKADG